MALGIFGGTFDPVHIGHLRAAEEVKEAFGLSQVYLIPGNIPPHKSRPSITGGDLRAGMVRAAVRGTRGLTLSDMEIRRGGISYSIDTVRLLEKRHGEVYFIIGMDAFAELNTWRLYTELFLHTNFIVIVRPTSSGRTDLTVLPEEVRRSMTTVDDRTLKHVSGKIVIFFRVTQLDISSTQIRRLVQTGRSIRYLVPPAVEKMIHERGLYRE